MEGVQCQRSSLICVMYLMFRGLCRDDFAFTFSLIEVLMLEFRTRFHSRIQAVSGYIIPDISFWSPAGNWGITTTCHGTDPPQVADCWKLGYVALSEQSCLWFKCIIVLHRHMEFYFRVVEYRYEVALCMSGSFESTRSQMYITFKQKYRIRFCCPKLQFMIDPTLFTCKIQFRIFASSILKYQWYMTHIVTTDSL